MVGVGDGEEVDGDSRSYLPSFHGGTAVGCTKGPLGLDVGGLVPDEAHGAEAADDAQRGSWKADGGPA